MGKKKQSDGVGVWKPLQLEGTVFAEGVEGLIGIEELVDYRLEKTGKDTHIFLPEANGKEKKSSRLKRKGTQGWEESEVCTDLKNHLPKKSKLDNVSKSSQKASAKKPIVNSEKCTKSMDDTDFDYDSSIECKDSNINIDAWSALGVPNVIIKALADQNFHSPTMIQSKTLASAILGRRDILGAAETGSGKTLAFGIPIINGILELQNKDNKPVKIITQGWSEEELGSECNGTSLVEHRNKRDKESESDDDDDDDDDDASDSDMELPDNDIGCVQVIDKIEPNKDTECKPSKPLYAVILTPTRELAMQIKDHLTKAAKYTNIKIAVLVGGMAIVKQERILSKGPQIVVATPGRLWELIQDGNPHLSQIDCIKYLTIDETDRMLERGHFQELQCLLEKINFNKVKVQERQTFVFSATLTLVHDIPNYLQQKKRKHIKSKIFKLTPGQKLQKIIQMIQIKNPKIVDITKATGTADSLTECRIACTIDHKDYYLYYFLKRYPGRTLVFCNSIGCVKRLGTLFSILNCKPLPLHANMQQRQRLKNLERFQADENGLLIATDVAARGLDIPNIEHVIHYQVPRTSESYIHRSGRTARAQKEGVTVLIMEPSEKHNYTKLCQTLGRTQDLPSFPVVDRLLVAIKERVDIAREIDKLELKCRRDNIQKGWLQKAIEDMDMILDEQDMETTMEAKETADLRRQLKIRKHQLSSLLAKPVVSKGFSGKYPDLNISTNYEEDKKAVEIMKTAINDNPKKRKESAIATVKHRKGPYNNKIVKKSKRS